MVFLVREQDSHETGLPRDDKIMQHLSTYRTTYQLYEFHAMSIDMNGKTSLEKSTDLC